MKKSEIKMAKQSKLKQKNNKIDFDSYYKEFFGPRWESLKKALLSETYSVKIQFSEDLEPYFMDAGSVFAAASLPLEKAESILDLCAAPGGKTLILSALSNPSAKILANELSMQRRERLIAVLNQSLPIKKNNNIRITPYDGSLMYARNRDKFDAILCDLPCSSERHLLSSPKHLNEWTSGRIKNLSYQQGALISSAFLMLKPGGYLLYATCALTDKENDQVIEKLLRKNQNVKPIEIEFDTIQAKIKDVFLLDIEIMLEKTKHGYHILPDLSQGAGPLYLALIKKTI